MPRALVAISEGSEELEAIGVIDVLRRAKVNVTVASVDKTKTVKCARGSVLALDLPSLHRVDCRCADEGRFDQGVRCGRSPRRYARCCVYLDGDVDCVGASPRLLCSDRLAEETEGKREDLRCDLRVSRRGLCGTP